MNKENLLPMEDTNDVRNMSVSQPIRTRHRSRRIQGLPPIEDCSNVDSIPNHNPAPVTLPVTLSSTEPSTLQQLTSNLVSTFIEQNTNDTNSDNSSSVPPEVNFTVNQQAQLRNVQTEVSTNVEQASQTVANLGGQKWGSFHCQKYREGGKCDLCKHMQEKEVIQSFHFGTSSKIHGHLTHDQFSTDDEKLRWYIYCIEDIPCHKQIVGSTTDPPARWRTHKSTCNAKNSNSTGLSKHFKEGCPHDDGKEKSILDVVPKNFLPNKSFPYIFKAAILCI